MTDGPRRTCLACRRVRPKAELVRLVRSADGTVAADPKGTAPGRGAYVCRDPRCIEQGTARRRLVQAFRKPCEAGASLAEGVRGTWQR